MTLLHYNRIGYNSIRLERDGLKSSRKESQPICTQKGNVAAAAVMDNIPTSSVQEVFYVL